MNPRIGEICAGYSGLAMALTSVLSGELAWVADNDPGASAILAHHYPSLPNYSDITTADWSASEPVDILAGGFPCQPVSLAGKQLGEADERWIWPSVVRAVRDLRPGLVFLENVSALVVRGLAGVAADLAQIGYVGSWCCLRAADVGACHRRERVFILARPAADARGGELQRRGIAGILGSAPPAEPCEGGQRERAGDPARNGGPVAQDANRTASGERWFAAPGQTKGGRPRADAGRSGGMRALADTHGRRLPELEELDSRTVAGFDRSLRHDAVGPVLDWGIYALAIRRHERAFGRPSPRPTEPGRTGERLSPRLVEWMMGLPDGWVTGVPGLSRNDQLKALGNGVVPRQAAAAARILLERADLPLIAAAGAA